MSGPSGAQYTGMWPFIGDVIWLADQNTLRGQFRLGRVVDTDRKGIVTDVHVRTFPSHRLSTVKLTQKVKKSSSKIPATILHMDVRRIVVLLPVEEQ